MLRPRETPFIGTGYSNKQPVVNHHLPFDFIQVESLFPRARSAPDDKQIADVIESRIAELTPSDHEHSAVLSLVTKITTILNGLSLTTSSFESVQVEEVCCVGSFAMGTILAGHGTADMVITLRTMPMSDAIYALTQKLMEALQEADPCTRYSSSRSERGLDITSNEAAVKILISTVEANVANLNPSLHMSKELIESHQTAVRHAKWFEQNAFHNNVKLLARLLHDISNRFEGLKPLTPWMICLLSHYSVMNNPDRQPLDIHIAFRRSLQLLACGFFLPYSTGIIDPCETGSVRIHSMLTPEEQDEICCTAQTLLRIYSHSGHKHVLGLERFPNIISEVTVWHGVIVTPSEKVYEKTTHEKKMDTS